MKILILSFLMTISYQLFSQYTTFNFIIVVDDKIAVTEINKAFIIKKYSNGNEDSLEVTYLPGRLSLLSSTNNKFFTMDTFSLYLKFQFVQYQNTNRSVHNYEVKIERALLNSAYAIYYVYNLANTKYKNKFAVKGNYTYEVESSEFNMKRPLKGYPK